MHGLKSLKGILRSEMLRGKAVFSAMLFYVDFKVVICGKYKNLNKITKI